MDLKHANILIVEDNVADAEFVKFFFKSECLANTYTICRTLAEATQQIHDQQFDLAFVDVNLTDGEGLSLLNELNPNLTKVIMLSGTDSAEKVMQAKELGAMGFIQKPLRKSSLDILIKALRGVSWSLVIHGEAA